MFDPEVVFVLPPEFPDAGTYSGTEAIARYMHGFLEPWTSITIEAEELTEAGDSVVATVRQRGVGETSGALTDLRYFQVWSFRGAKVVLLENLRERSEAHEAALRTRRGGY